MYMIFRGLILSLIMGWGVQSVSAQEVGMSFSYFLPKGGYFTTPISPFSFRGVGVDFNRFVGVETGFTLYRMSGLAVKDLPYEPDGPVIGPVFTLLIPLELVLQVGNSQQEFRLKGGGFLFRNFDKKLHSGNLDGAIRSFEGWDVANSDFDYENNFGFGFQAGVEYIIYVTSQFGISLGGNYFIGDADMGLEGSYTGGVMAGPLETKSVSYPDSKVDFTGLEISLGILFSGQ